MPEPQQHLRSQIATVNPLPGQRVLIVEDEEGVRDMLVELLEGQGYAARAASRPSEALALAKREEEPPCDVLLTDVVLPQMNGFELAERLRRRWPELRVVAMSGYAGRFSMNGSAAPEGVPLLTKPFTLHALLGALEATPELAGAGASRTATPPGRSGPPREG
jgi:hypothetical protein